MGVRLVLADGRSHFRARCLTPAKSRVRRDFLPARHTSARCLAPERGTFNRTRCRAAGSPSRRVAKPGADGLGGCSGSRGRWRGEHERALVPRSARGRATDLTDVELIAMAERPRKAARAPPRADQGGEQAEREDRPDGEALDDLGSARPPPGPREKAPRGAIRYSPPGAGPLRRLGLVARRRAGLERHCGGDQALRAAGTRGTPIRRGWRTSGGFCNRDGGFELTPGRGSGRHTVDGVGDPGFPRRREGRPQSAFGYLHRMRRSGGSYRYSARYVTTPVWVTAQVLPALARRPFHTKASRTKAPGRMTPGRRAAGSPSASLTASMPRIARLVLGHDPLVAVLPAQRAAAS